MNPSLVNTVLSLLKWDEVICPSISDPPSIPTRMRKILLAFTRQRNVGMTGQGWMRPKRPRAVVFFFLSTTSSSEQLLIH